MLFLSSCASSLHSKKVIRQQQSTQRSQTNNKSCHFKYKVKNKRYCVLKNAHNFQQTGVASWYGPKFHGKKTASGQIYNQNKLTAAHKNLPFGTRVRVLNLRTKQSVIVTINDRGPFHGGRIIDLSKRAAKLINMSGTDRVHVKAL
ncbi:MAG: septal ring lytic transglycosylase RlpA family protein [Myxococcales bacterium]|nr:MAG: septal ring lytic transglycosylase RlpA family protein [Myxococcales bacterium]